VYLLITMHQHQGINPIIKLKEAAGKTTLTVRMIIRQLSEISNNIQDKSWRVAVKPTQCRMQGGQPQLTITMQLAEAVTMTT